MSLNRQISSVALAQIELIHKQANYLWTSFFALFAGAVYSALTLVERDGFGTLSATVIVIAVILGVQIIYMMKVHHREFENIINSVEGLSQSPSLVGWIINPGLLRFISGTRHVLIISAAFILMFIFSIELLSIWIQDKLVSAVGLETNAAVIHYLTMSILSILLLTFYRKVRPMVAGLKHPWKNERDTENE